MPPSARNGALQRQQAQQQRQQQPFRRLPARQMGEVCCGANREDLQPKRNVCPAGSDLQAKPSQEQQLLQEGERHSYLMPLLEGSDSRSIATPAGHFSAHQGVLGAQQANVHLDKGGWSLHACPPEQGLDATLYRNIGGMGMRLGNLDSSGPSPRHQQLDLEGFWGKHLAGIAPSVSGDLPGAPQSTHLSPSWFALNHWLLHAILPTSEQQWGAPQPTTNAPPSLCLSLQQQQGSGWGVDMELHHLGIGIGGKQLLSQRQWSNQIKRYTYATGQRLLRRHQRQLRHTFGQWQWWLGLQQQQQALKRLAQQVPLHTWPVLQVGEALVFGNEQIRGSGVIGGVLGLRFGTLRLQQHRSVERYQRGREQQLTFTMEHHQRYLQRSWLDVLIAADWSDNTGREGSQITTMICCDDKLPTPEQARELLKQPSLSQGSWVQQENLRHRWRRQGLYLLHLPHWTAQLRTASIGAYQQHALWRHTSRRDEQLITTVMRQRIRAEYAFPIGMHQWLISSYFQQIHAQQATPSSMPEGQLALHFSLRYESMQRSQMLHGLQVLNLLGYDLPVQMTGRRFPSHQQPYQIQWQLQLTPQFWQALENLPSKPWQGIARQPGGDPWLVWQLYQQARRWRHQHQRQQEPKQAIEAILKLLQRHPLQGWQLLLLCQSQRPSVAIDAPMYQQQLEQSQRNLLPYLQADGRAHPAVQAEHVKKLLLQVRRQLLQTEQSLRGDQILSIMQPVKKFRLLQALKQQRQLASQLYRAASGPARQKQASSHGGNGTERPQ